MKTVLITGCSRGIGRACCEYFKSQNWQVIGLDIADSCDSADIYIKLDLSDSQNALKIANILNKYGIDKLDALVNNAAVQIVKKIDEIEKSDWENTLNVNLMSPFFLIQNLLQHLKNAKGNVVNISSIHGNLTKKYFTVYATSKGALNTLTKSLSLELAPEICINAVLPAATATEMLVDGFKSSPEKLELLKDYHPLKKIAEPSDVASLVYYLAENKGFITGSLFEINGGIGSKLHDPE